MPSPLPGMDPYLERGDVWPDVHNTLIVWLRQQLQPALRPDYRIRIEQRIYLDASLLGVADVGASAEPGSAAGPRTEAEPSGAVIVTMPVPLELRESYLEVWTVGASEPEQLITVIELLSPANKQRGRGRDLYLRKREEVLASRTHLVEIDLIRTGDPMPFGAPDDAALGDYRILVSRGGSGVGSLHAFGVRDAIPRVALLLRGASSGPDIDVGSALAGCYDDAGYDLSIDYTRDAHPPLPGDDGAWADALLRDRGLR